MKSVKYYFNTYKTDNNYIFQFAGNKKLTDIYHSHDFYEIIMILKGNSKQYINDTVYQTQKGNVVILKPEDSHCFLSQSEDLSMLSLSVEYSEAMRFFQDFNLDTIIPSSKELIIFDVQNISSKLNFTSWFPSKKPFEYQLKFLLCSAIELYLDYLNQNSEIPSELLNAIEQMKEPHNMQAGIPAFVELSNYSRSHLTRLIRKHYNLSLQEFIMDMRLETAYNNIILSGDFLEDIACSVGYSSFSHFNKIFKEKYGVSPAYLRKTKKLWTI